MVSKALLTHFPPVARRAYYWPKEIIQLLLDGCAAADASVAFRWRAERIVGGDCVDDDN